jgi:hypothetical protein
MPITGQDLIVTRTALSQARVVDATFPDTPPDGACVMRIDGFALTANNITYGVAADMLGYWDFFPTEDAADGRIPVWGFATVVASAHPDIPVGERVYGYVPMSTHVMVWPGQITKTGFMDVVPHRAARAPIYNHYAFTRLDPQWQADREPLISLIRPLFTTSFLLDDLHRENDCFGARQIILSSASSKTAIGLAFLLSRNAGVSVVGLTSEGNRAFVESLGCYDTVLGYDQIAKLSHVASAFVDMAGNADLRRRIHDHLRDDLKSSRAVGMTHWQDSRGLGGDLPGAKPEFFFAPSYAQARLKDLGPAEFHARLGKAWTAFTDDAARWITISRESGPDAVLACYQAMLKGEIDPAQGHYLSMA